MNSELLKILNKILSNTIQQCIQIIIYHDQVWLFQERKGGSTFKNQSGDFPGGAVVKNPPANAGDTGSIPGRGRSYMPWSS